MWGGGGLNSIDFDILCILVYFLFLFQPVFNLGIDLGPYGRPRLSLRRLPPVYPPANDLQVSI